MRHLARAGVIVNCMVTSPPFYGQRDYGVDGQIGLEEHPREFVANLVACFEAARPVLAENGSLWVNLGDTYWSGKGEHKSGEIKQSARRFGLRAVKPRSNFFVRHPTALGKALADQLPSVGAFPLTPEETGDQAGAIRDLLLAAFQSVATGAPYVEESAWFGTPP